MVLATLYDGLMSVSGAADEEEGTADDEQVEIGVTAGTNVEETEPGPD